MNIIYERKSYARYSNMSSFQFDKNFRTGILMQYLYNPYVVNNGQTVINYAQRTLTLRSLDFASS